MEENKPAVKQAEDRLEVLRKIEEYERLGKFDEDVENDPPAKELKPEDVDYLKKKLSSKIKTAFAYRAAQKFLNKIKKEKILDIKEIIGLENIENLKTGAIITCNHFNAFDCFAVEEVFLRAKKKRGDLHRIIREGNYTGFDGFYGMLMRHCNTIPLSSNRSTMKNMLAAVDTLLQRGKSVLVYAEQSMWWNYRKPRPFKKTAFKFATKNKVPVIPIFVTMEDSDRLGPDGFYMQTYTIHIGKAIYPDAEKSLLVNADEMAEKNFEFCKNAYETAYNKKLVYTTEVVKED